MKAVLLSIVMILATTSTPVYYSSSSFSSIPEKILNSQDELGVDNDDYLTTMEIEFVMHLFNYFNSVKKVAFISGSAGTTIVDKNDFFDIQMFRYEQGLPPMASVLHVFSKVETIRTGGFDAAIVYESVYRPTTKQVIKTLRRKQRKSLQKQF